ncbi:MAG: triose-phosphate isomerase [Roseobacter sp.]|jgi:triosephosphate isomerase|nr:triose-phosphate isomerase [Roseobacter sp.]
MPRKIAAGNWKMNGTLGSLSMIDVLAQDHAVTDVEILLCPPAPLLPAAAARATGGSVTIGAQNCHFADKGAHTGDVSADMLREAGATAIIVGHSERREAYAETDADVAAKARAAQTAGLVAIICLGETLAQREAGEALAVIRAQLQGSVPDGCDAERLVIAYEPIWAIGTGHIPTMDQIAQVHDCLRRDLHDKLGENGNDVPLLYGGSVKADNAAEIFALREVNGALVGGASLKAQDFSPIVSALHKS